MLGVFRTVVFGGLRLRVCGFSVRVRHRWACGSRAPSGVASDCRVGLDPRGNIVDGLISRVVHHSMDALVYPQNHVRGVELGFDHQGRLLASNQQSDVPLISGEVVGGAFVRVFPGAGPEWRAGV